MSAEIHIDGSQGEGGGQIVRTAVALAAVRQLPVRISKIRAGRKRPGLKRQHLAAVRAAAEVCGGTLRGDTLGSSELHFTPGPPVAGDYEFAVGSAGSACLVFQTVLWPLLSASGSSRVVFEGGTHNPLAPPFDFVERVFLPIVRKMGARVEVELERYGFMPAGGGRFIAELEGGARLQPIELLDAGEVVSRRATALVANLPGTIAIRELRSIRELLGWRHEECLPKVVQDSRGPGNAVLLEIEREHASELVTTIGERHVSAEQVAERAAHEAEEYLNTGVPVGAHLADQLVLPFALAGGGHFRTGPLSDHTRTNIEVARRMCATEIHTVDAEDGAVLVHFSS